MSDNKRTFLSAAKQYSETTWELHNLTFGSGAHLSSAREVSVYFFFHIANRSLYE